MTKMKRLKSKQKYNLNQLTFSFDTSKTIQESYGTESMQFNPKEELMPKDTNIPERKRRTLLCLTERKCIAKMTKQGIGVRAIGTFLNRSPSVIARDLKRNGGIEVYDPIEAEKACRKRNEGKSIRISQINKGKEPNAYRHLKFRIENLEMQLEIITETLKRLNHE